MPLEPQTKEIPFRFGLDVTEDEEGQPNGALELVNYDFDEDGVLLRRGGFVRVEVLGSNLSKFLPDAPGAERGYPRLLLQDAQAPVAIDNDLTARITQTITTLSPGARIQHVDMAFALGCVCVATVCSGETSTDNTIYYQRPADFITFIHVIDATSGAIYFTTSYPAYCARVAVATNATTGAQAFIFCLAAGNAFTAPNSVVAYTLWQPTPGINVFAVLPTTITVTTLLSTGDSQSSVPVNRTVDMASLDNGTCQVTWLEGKATLTWKAWNLRWDAFGTVVVGLASVLPVVPTRAQCWVWNAAGTPIYGCMTAVGDPNIVIVYAGSAYTIGTSNTHLVNLTLSSTGVSGEFLVSWNTQIIFSATAGWGKGDIKYRTFRTSGPPGPSGSEKTYYGMQVATEAETINGRFRMGISATAVPETQYANLSLVYYDVNLGVLLAEGQLAYDEWGYWINYPFEDLNEFFFTYPPPLVAIGVSGMIPVPVAMESGPAVQGRRSRGVRRLRIAYFESTSEYFHTAHLQHTHFLTGSYLAASDETRVFPAAFLVAPAIVPQTFPPSNPNVWGYVALFEYVDFHGNIQVSPPSPTLIYTHASATAPTPTLEIQVPDILRDFASLSKFQVHAVRVKVYRTQMNKSEYNLIYATHVADAGTGGIVTFTDSMSDTNAALGETLYSTGGVLASELAPPLTHLTAHRNRLFGVRSDIPETIMFTTETFEPNFPRWNSSLSLRVDNQGGPPLAVASMYDKLVILQHQQICVVTGEGPDALGQGIFSMPETIARGVGVEPGQVGSVVETPIGVMFAHRTGIHLLTPGLEIVPIGRALGGKNFGEEHPIHRARFLPSRSQVWFLAQDVVFVYDLRTSRWTTFTGVWDTFWDVAECDGQVYAISQIPGSPSGNYTLFRYSFDDRRDQDPAVDTESLVGFPQKIGLPWLRRDRVQQMRLWKVFVSGSQEGGWADDQADVVVEAFSQQAERDKSSTVADNTYIWSAATLQAEPENFLLGGRLVSQRGRALRCRVRIQPSPTYTGGPLFRLSAVTYDYGVLPTRGKARARPSAF